MLGYVKSDNLNPTHPYTNLTDITQAYYVNDDWKKFEQENMKPELFTLRRISKNP